MLIENVPFPQDPRVFPEAQALISNGFRVSVICPALSGQPWREIINGVHVFRYPAPPEKKTFFGYFWEYGYSLVVIFAISILVSFKPGFDIIHAANPPDILVFIAIFYKLFGKRFIFDHHDLSPELYYARFRDKGSKNLYRTLLWLERLSCSSADYIITTNQSYKRIEMQRDHVKEGKITIVRNGPSDQLLKTVPALGLGQTEKKNIVYAGVIGNQDGVEHLIRALHYVINSFGRTNILCIIIGDGNALSDIKALSVELRLTDYILFTGWIEKTEVISLLRSADICVAPEPSNRYNDNSTMIKIMEYMAVGKPIIAFDLPEHRVSAQEAALYARPNDELDFSLKIAELMDDTERRRKMGEFGRDRVEKDLAWSHQIQYLLEAYGKLNTNI
jgi:glycosyltransferase involved in cell wall biosynthesis